MLKITGRPVLHSKAWHRTPHYALALRAQTLPKTHPHCSSIWPLASIWKCDKSHYCDSFKRTEPVSKQTLATAQPIQHWSKINGILGLVIRARLGYVHVYVPLLLRSDTSTHWSGFSEARARSLAFTNTPHILQTRQSRPIAEGCNAPAPSLITGGRHLPKFIPDNSGVVD